MRIKKQTKDFAGFLKPEEIKKLTKGKAMVRLDEVGEKRLVKKGREDFAEARFLEALFYLTSKKKDS